jgi:hypothetical protein
MPQDPIQQAAWQASGRNCWFFFRSVSKNPGQYLANLKSDPEIVASACVENNLKQAQYIPSDPYYTYPGTVSQYYLSQTMCPEAWSLQRGTVAQPTTVAVLDAGFDFTNPDLTANLWVNPDETPNNGNDDDGNRTCVRPLCETRTCNNHSN